MKYMVSIDEWDGENYSPSCCYTLDAGCDSEAVREMRRGLKIYDCEECDVHIVIKDERGRRVHGEYIENDFSLRAPDVYV